MVRVRAYEPGDREFVLGLAPRLTVGMPAWRSPEGCLAAVEGWVAGSIAQAGGEVAVFVAEDEDGERLGFATVTAERHWSGERQASVGELAAAESAEGRGVGGALLAACEAWAREHGYRAIALATGAGNARALAFYRGRGFLDEDVRLVKLL